MQEVEVIGNLYPDNKHQSGNVYSVSGVSPTLMSGTHGYGIGAFIETVKLTDAIGISLFESDEFGGWKLPKDGVAPTLRSNKVCAGIIQIERIDMRNAEFTIPESRAEQSRAEQSSLIMFMFWGKWITLSTIRLNLLIEFMTIWALHLLSILAVVVDLNQRLLRYRKWNSR